MYIHWVLFTLNSPALKVEGGRTTIAAKEIATLPTTVTIIVVNGATRTPMLPYSSRFLRRFIAFRWRYEGLDLLHEKYTIVWKIKYGLIFYSPICLVFTVR